VTNDKDSELAAMMFVMVLFVVSLFGFGIYKSLEIKARKPALERELVQMHCQLVGYKGKSEEKVYQCDTGLYYVESNVLKRAY
jgi:hypothetical protein